MYHCMAEPPQALKKNKKILGPLAKSVLAGGNVLAAPFFMVQITENGALKLCFVCLSVCGYTYT